MERKLEWSGLAKEGFDAGEVRAGEASDHLTTVDGCKSSFALDKLFEEPDTAREAFASIFGVEEAHFPRFLTVDVVTLALTERFLGCEKI